MPIISPNAMRNRTKAQPIQIYEPDRFTIDDLLDMSSPMMNRVMKAFSSEHKQVLLADCLVRIEYAQSRVCGVGQVASDSRGISRFPNPYTLLKKYTYMYTCLSGWQSETDLEERERAQLAQNGLSEEQREGFRAKGWLKD